MKVEKRKVGRPKARVKPIRMTVFVDDGTKSNIDSLALMYDSTASQIVMLGVGALTRQLPKEDRDLLEVIQQKRVAHRV